MTISIQINISHKRGNAPNFSTNLWIFLSDANFQTPNIHQHFSFAKSYEISLSC